MIQKMIFLSTSVVICILLISGCEKIDVTRKIKISTLTYNDLTARSVSISGEFIDFGNKEITEYGICWASMMNPSVEDNKSVIGQQPSEYSFSTEVTGLEPDQVYFIRAYAMTTDTVAYGRSIVFITPRIEIPIVITWQVTQITTNSASTGGNITDVGNGEITQRGVCWGIVLNPTIRDSKTIDGTGPGEFTSQITGLFPDLTYYVRAYATIEAGTVYGSSYSFTTPHSK